VSADGPVRSVRLFSRAPFDEIRSVALDTSSLTSVALIRILLAERYGISPRYVYHAPDLERMLDTCDAALLIGDLHLFDSAAAHVMDLGQEWKLLTGLPFVYAAWLARSEADLESISAALHRAKGWGTARLEELSGVWSREMALPLDRVREYFLEIMQYDLTRQHMAGFEEYHRLCRKHNLIAESLS
jgi:chorismate dehydratase